jgi:hypothetical protein
MNGVETIEREFIPKNNTEKWGGRRKIDILTMKK